MSDSVVRDGDARPQGDPDFWGPESRLDRFRPGGGRSGWSFDAISERLRDPRVGVVALVVLALLAGVVFYEVGSGSADASAAPAPASSVAPRRSVASVPESTAPPGSTVPADSPSASAPAGKGSGTKVVVHVAGAVVTPGVVQLAAGSRVIDAVEAAGGGLPNADLDRLNLAAKLVDGERVLVQHVGDPPAPADPSTAGGDAATGSSTGSSTGAATGPVNLNTATEAQLDQLPGIGPSLARAIVAERTRRGGFRSVNELREVRGIGERRFADLKRLVTV